ncbi:Fe-S cluster assembly protein SufD [Kineococcus xinjiangensis]|uniref:Fe-S cluster assembly protein SufD n=1 Tax=Kineococcus xinjiangensis TaxID=512762 RepID=A0A2S6IPF2_9ACTN|nr:Fe-S cluster assembly protein SufD [Kineococcus xinjiangensis]PPK96137.1 Fe-S cluster assembly protein SufD [Kineococcus xinjiangensis]
MTVVEENRTPGDELADTPGATGRAHSHGAGTVPDASRAARRTSFEVADFAVPTGREEEWRFSPFARIKALFEVAAAESAPALEVSAPEGVEVRSGSLEEVGAGTGFVPGDRVAAAAWQAGGQAHLVRIPAEAELDEPVLLTLRGTGGATSGHLVVDAGRHSRATVVLDHVGSGTHRGGVEVRAGDGAQLTFVTLQEWDSGAVQVSQQDVLVGRDATVKHFAVTLGGDVVRLSTNVRYAAPGGDAQCLGLYFSDAGQHLEHRLFVDHEATHCKSYVEYKGALQGETARSVWIGDVLIRAAAEGTETYELNRNLVLTDGARADSVPNLEIETGEIVGAGHASATGRFDDEQLFYLQSRGLAEADARRLVVRGFFADILQRIGVPAVQERLLATIETELETTMPAAAGATVPAAGSSTMPAPAGGQQTDAEKAEEN